MQKFCIKTFCLLLIAVVTGCTPKEQLVTQSDVDLSKYQGVWYEIARLPNSFEKDCSNITANYKIIADNKISVTNSCLYKNSKLKTVNGTARLPNVKDKGKLKVSFFWPFSGDYQIIYTDYKLALVGSPNKKYLWVLAREKKISNQSLQFLLNMAKQQGFKTENIIMAPQN